VPTKANICHRAARRFAILYCLGRDSVSGALRLQTGALVAQRAGALAPLPAARVFTLSMAQQSFRSCRQNVYPAVSLRIGAGDAQMLAFNSVNTPLRHRTPKMMFMAFE
jgi:hypothetical protein